MILQVEDELYELILQTLMECGYDGVIEDIVVYQECSWEDEKVEKEISKELKKPKLSLREKKKKNVAY